MSRICVSAAAVCVLLAAPAAGQESALRDGLDRMGRDIAIMLNEEANRRDERLEVSFRPARTVHEGVAVYCGPLSVGLRDALYERVQWHRDDMRMTSFDVVVADARVVSPPDVTMAWTWDGAGSIGVGAHVLLAGDRGRRYPASLDAEGLGDPERGCLFTFRPGGGEVKAEKRGILREEPSYNRDRILGEFEAGATFLVVGELSSEGRSGAVWSVVQLDDEETGTWRDAFTADLASGSAERERPARRRNDEAPRVPEADIGDVFRDCAHCPEMVVVPAGSFMMGSPSSEEGRDDDEGPRHGVTIGSAFAVGVYEVTFAEWDACVSSGGCGGYRPNDRGWGRGQRPVINVSWDDAQSYAAWLSGETGKSYRLLSESEWEYVARAGTQTRYWWGNDIGRNRANCDGCGSRWDNERTAPVGSFAANAFGLHDVHGNVWEWVQDCRNVSYAGAPDDGSAWERGRCSRRVLRGGSWSIVPRFLRAASRGRLVAGLRSDFAGFRVVRTFTP